jgi:hypothetical protein
MYERATYLGLFYLFFFASPIQSRVATREKNEVNFPYILKNSPTLARGIERKRRHAEQEPENLKVYNIDDCAKEKHTFFQGPCSIQ